MLFQVFIPFILQSIAMKETIFDNIYGKYIKCWRGMDPIWHPRWPPNTKITSICNFLVPLDSSCYVIKDCVSFSNTLSQFLRQYMHSTETKLILCLCWPRYVCTCHFDVWVTKQNLTVSIIMNQIALSVLFRFLVCQEYKTTLF